MHPLAPTMRSASHFALRAVLPLAVTLFLSCSRASEEQPNAQTPPRLPAVEFMLREPLEKDELTLSFNLSEEEGTTTVYRVQEGQPADEQYVEAIANKLGVLGEPREENGSIVVEGPIGRVDARSQDGFRFSGEGPRLVSSPLASIADEMLIDAVRAFLAERGLLPDHADSGFVSRAGGYAKEPAVSFSDTRVPGNAAPSLGVVLSEQGSVVRISYDWPALEPIGDYPLLSEKEAFERIFTPKARPAIFVDTAVELQSVGMFFWGVATDDRGTILVPLYEFRGTEGSSIWVNALPDEHLEWTGTPSAH